ncbi:MAG TPA: hypothetical protein DEO65_12580 [Bacillus bacterium]|uniref:cysteine-rich CWC family protein n=1 Tax=Siminovitchia fordii TaxID=254759 RepID=UPI000A0787FD|nr:cysteine-rich CWC family protein [Siminovitchia fordii]HBZ10697.1 hypothetical protein [Bacillus sp. (in: firmicutes)]
MKKQEEKCPICSKDNNCCFSLDKNLGNCWCSKESFPKEVFDQIPSEELYKTCICKQCLDRIKHSLN